MRELGDFTEVGLNSIRFAEGPCAQSAPETRRADVKSLSGFLKAAGNENPILRTFNYREF